MAAPLWGAVLRRTRPDLADLDGLRAGGLLEALALRRRADRRRFAEPIPCPHLPLPATWEEYEASLGRNLRQNLRRYARRLEQEAPGPVTRRLVVRPEEIDPTLDDLARLHQQVRTARGQAGAFRSPELTAFHHLAARRFLEAGPPAPAPPRRRTGGQWPSSTASARATSSPSTPPATTRSTPASARAAT